MIQRGGPLFVVTAEANAGMVKMLPILLEQARALIGKRRLTVVFDRGGYSPKLFLRLIDAEFDILTYRKGRCRPVPRKRFQKHEGRLDGRRIAYVLADQEVRLLRGKLRLRQVTRLTDSGHQTAILTSRRDLQALEVAYRMFERWRQENFFKYLSDEYALDALVEHAVVPDDPTREVPNPARKALDDALRDARAELTRLQADYGREAFARLEGARPTMRALQRAQAALARGIRAALKCVTTLARSQASAASSAGARAAGRRRRDRAPRARAPALDQRAKNGRLSGGERSGLAHRTALPARSSGGPNAHSVGPGQCRRSGGDRPGAARAIAAAELPSSQSCGRRVMRRAKSLCGSLPRIPVAPSLLGFNPIKMSKKRTFRKGLCQEV